jgi:hypothetical protein
MLSHSVIVVVSIAADIQERLDYSSIEQQKLDHLKWVVRKHTEKSQVSTQTKMFSCKLYHKNSISFDIQESMGHILGSNCSLDKKSECQTSACS